MATTTTRRPARRRGTTACYRSGCSHFECRAASARYAAYRKRLQQRGEPTTDLIDANPARAHARALLDAGMPFDRIVDAAGVTRSSLSRLLYSRGDRPAVSKIRQPTAEAILTVRPVPNARRREVDVTHTKKIIRGMAALGYTQAWIRDQLGYVNHTKINLRVEHITADLASRIREVAEKHAHIPGPSSAARANAARRGWTVDQLWEALDDTATGDEPASVDWVAVQRVAAGTRPEHRLDSATRAAAIDLLAGQGLSATEIGRRLRTSGSDISRNLARRHQPQETAP